MSEVTSGPRPSDKWIPWYFVAFFVALTAILAHFVWLAMHNFPGTVVDKAYEQGLAYNQVLQAVAAQDKLDWRATLKIAAPERALRLTYTLQDAASAPLRGATVQCWLYRPSSSKLDENMILTETRPGVYEAEIAKPVPGLWEVRLAAQRGADRHQHSERLTLP